MNLALPQQLEQYNYGAMPIGFRVINVSAQGLKNPFRKIFIILALICSR
jgi:hypothetical protein